MLFHNHRGFTFVVFILIFSIQSYSQNKQHDMQMNMHGDSVMGFGQNKTTHHFKLTPNGGSIQVTANSPGDTVSIHQIRLHLGHIAAAFSNGDFSMPEQVHSQVPPGVPEMERQKNEINYQFETITNGGIVRINTKNQNALAAIHQFLEFQIKAHKTGDSMKIQK
jgi:hypothetical protein